MSKAPPRTRVPLRLTAQCCLISAAIGVLGDGASAQLLDGIPGSAMTAETSGVSQEASAPAGAQGSRPLMIRPLAPSTETLPLGTREGGGVSNGSWLARTAGALVLVIGLIFGVKWLMKKAAGTTGSFRGQLGAGGRAPSGVLFVLGRYPVSRGLTLVLVRLDRRVLLLSQSSDGFATLAEVTDAEEVASISRKCSDEAGTSAAARFASELGRARRDPAIVGEPKTGAGGALGGSQLAGLIDRLSRSGGA